jgi:uncharacterized protein (UPF0332 family)
MKGNKTDIIKYRHDRAFETLAEAKSMIDLGFWNSSINRIYYGCYYMVTALLIDKSLDTSSHKGVRVLFGLHFVQTGLVLKEDGHFFSKLYDKRQNSDYDDFVSNDSETALNLLNQAEEFVNKLSILLKSNN